MDCKYRLDLVKSLPKLKTLDNTDIVRREKEQAGYQYSDEEEEEEDEEPAYRHRNLGGK